MRVKVYKNTHNGLFSIQYQGRTIGYAEEIHLSDCKFIVRPAGRDHVRRTRRKVVHAFVEGDLDRALNYKLRLVDIPEAKKMIPTEYYSDTLPGFPHINRAYYNPYEVDTFINTDTKQPIYKCDSAELGVKKGVWYA